MSVELVKGKGRTCSLFTNIDYPLLWPSVTSDEKVRRVLTNPPPLTVTGYHYKAQSG